MEPEIRYESSRQVRDAIASLGRTEDVRFSPNNRRLAIAAFNRNRIAIFDVDISSSAGVRVALSGGVQITSSVLNEPHGVDFLDDDHVIVASRGGGNVATFRLPAGGGEVHSREVAPSAIWSAEPSTHLRAPSTVSVTRIEPGLSEILICDHGEHIVSKHVLNSSSARSLVQHDVLLRKLLLLPDGVAVSPDRRWIAVSNHATHSVLMYENSMKLGADTDPVGILRRVYAPHGLRFSADGHHLLVADAEAPHILVYVCERNDWCGVRNPTATVTIMDDETFRQGQLGPGEGGPKGLDIDAGSRVVAVTSRCQPIAFFDLAALLRQPTAKRGTGELESEDFAFELRLMDDQRILANAERALKARAESSAMVHYVLNSRSWRITEPLRRLDTVLRRRS